MNLTISLQIKNKDIIKSYEYHIQKTKRFVRAIHKDSKIHRFNNYPATQAHHIFLSSQFPELADIPENIIALTPDQHFRRTHPNNTTSVIDKSYQAICSISKLDTIENDYRNDLGNYSKKDFIDIINAGLGTDIQHTTDFKNLKHKIITYYIQSRQQTVEIEQKTVPREYWAFIFYGVALAFYI